MNRLKSIIKEFVEEKNRKALEEQNRQKEYERKSILAVCSKEFVDVLANMPQEYNIKNSLSTHSFPGEFCGDNSIEIRIPKDDASKELRPAQLIALRNEIQGRIERLRNEAQLMRDEFYRQKDFERNILSEKSFYSGNEKELLDFDAQARVDEAHLYQMIFMRFWKYDIVCVSDSVDSPYIKVKMYLQIT